MSDKEEELKPLLPAFLDNSNINWLKNYNKMTSSYFMLCKYLCNITDLVFLDGFFYGF